MAANGDNQTRITTDPHTDATPFWSPDDSQITFSTNRDGNFEVYVMDANGGNQTNLTQNAAVDAVSSWR